jgi:hypothetical protein
MRIAAALLVALNLAFFAWSRYGTSAGAAAEGVLARPNEPEKLKIVPAAEVRTSALAGCLEWGAFTAAESARAERALEGLGLGPRLGQRRAEETAGWWVFIPSQGSRQGALKKAAELKAMGVNDYYIMGEEGDSPWSLSLGVFRTEQAALARLGVLRDLGVRTALVGSRDTLLGKIWLQVKGIDPALEARLKDLVRQLEGSELRPCAP